MTIETLLITGANNPDFQQILLRGCEWAATGKVTSCGKKKQESA